MKKKSTSKWLPIAVATVLLCTGVVFLRNSKSDIFAKEHFATEQHCETYISEFIEEMFNALELEETDEVIFRMFLDGTFEMVVMPNNTSLRLKSIDSNPWIPHLGFRHGDRGRAVAEISRLFYRNSDFEVRFALRSLNRYNMYHRSLDEWCSMDVEIPECPPYYSDYSVFFPHPSDCRCFFHCSDGVAYLKQCPADLHWNRTLETCDHPYFAGCKRVNCQERFDTELAQAQADYNAARASCRGASDEQACLRWASQDFQSKWHVLVSQLGGCLITGRWQ